MSTTTSATVTIPDATALQPTDEITISRAGANVALSGAELLALIAANSKPGPSGIVLAVGPVNINAPTFEPGDLVPVFRSGTWVWVNPATAFAASALAPDATLPVTPAA